LIVKFPLIEEACRRICLNLWHTYCWLADFPPILPTEQESSLPMRLEHEPEAIHGCIDIPKRGETSVA
jgi:hypothetical protein